ncbi:hypothetical protein [Halorubrum lacusprofundi]|uniref:Uncharacterized protein n=1 Tax=Halorubrum lacusprofundi (strain ATCC 49239 / DSM 5036 / JCM 8891 / ACAM 34) TaxID=416348 RepID=B9LTP7_HALLT|nr:hypothetical protein [Halorubrum lacusprofundi]ACM56181.1 conserved hypothetical protein [Halorubrum lacusprofundi ATCC 49239]
MGFPRLQAREDVKGILDAFGSLASALLAGFVMLAFAVLSLFVTVFVVDAAASIAGLNPEDGFVVLGATVLAGTAILAGGVGFATPENES